MTVDRDLTLRDDYMTDEESRDYDDLEWEESQRLDAESRLLEPATPSSEKAPS